MEIKNRGVAGMGTVVKRLRESYISTLNHDLKIPAIAQMRALELLLNENTGSINAVQKEILNSTLESCRHMYDRLNSLSYSYKLENKDYILNCEKTDISKLFRQKFSNLNDKLKNKNVNLNLFCACNDLNAFIDRTQFNNAIDKILNYAIASSTNNQVICELKKSANNVLISIVFQSSYITTEKLKKLFSKYSTPCEKLDKVGSGLDLYLAKQIIKAHNGSVSISGKTNFNTVCVKLPATNEY